MNERTERATFQLQQTVVDADGNVVVESDPTELSLDPGQTLKHDQAVEVGDPQLWDLDTPYLYQLVTRITDEAGREVDRYTTDFGIREIRFDPDHGFFLNGRHVKLKGTNNHQDHAGIGVALPDAMQEYRIRKLKEMGSNAYRVSHHPASPALLDACDRLGMLVIDENRLMGINDYHLDQLEHLIVRDRNHPSVILWSVGNEEWAIEGNIKGARIADYMQRFTKRLDPTRRVTAAISGGWGGISTTIEVMGVNYIKHGDTDQQHREYPEQIIVGTEETTTQATRGIYYENADLAHLPPQEDGSSGGNAELGWQHYAARDYAAGVFYWTGFDYRGEPTPYGWPAVLSQFGILDNCGFPKDGFYYLKSWWQDAPVLHVFPHWNWEGREGETITVHAHSNCEEVELFVNGESQGRKEMPENGSLAWDVTYEPGEIVAKGYTDGKLVLEDKRVTTGPSAAVALEADRPTIAADGSDVAVIKVSIEDRNGHTVPTADDLVHFEIDGPGKIIGVGNGNPSSHEAERNVPSMRSQTIGDWEAPPAADTETPVHFEARFDRPDLQDREQARLLLTAIGREQTVTLNGQKLYHKADREAATAEFPMQDLPLRDKGNVLEIDALPFKDWRERETTANAEPARWNFRTPAAPYQRKAFNGLAQVIVQNTGESGTITLTARGEGLEQAQMEVEAQAQDRE
ncbi:MAG: beta-galactosidase [Puniceicoccaceae bacterium 5H]|nr:MAG: beta-galactosidase [Puniceicoccaceae bacterium 5H]